MLAPLLQRAKSGRFTRASAHHVTMWLGSRYPDLFPMVFVLGFPKSGTTWACHLVADYMRLPFPQFALLPHTFAAVVHGHEVPRPRHQPLVYVVRDGRDAAVSFYFMALRSMRKGERQHAALLPGSVEEAENIREHLPRFLERFMVKTPASPAPWGEHCRAFFAARPERSGILRYERLLSDGAAELAGCLRDVTGEEPEMDRVGWALEKHSFARTAKRKPGEEDANSHRRKGVAGDWRNYFTREAAEVFDHHAGDVLVELGYERDRSWVDSCDAGALASGGSTAAGAASVG